MLILQWPIFNVDNELLTIDLIVLVDLAFIEDKENMNNRVNADLAGGGDEHLLCVG